MDLSVSVLLGIKVRVVTDNDVSYIFNRKFDIIYLLRNSALFCFDSIRKSQIPFYISGSRCEFDIDECLSNPCQYNGNCTDKVNGYSCQCVPGISGDSCEININECDSNPCENDGQCLDKVNG